MRRGVTGVAAALLLGLSAVSLSGCGGAPAPHALPTPSPTATTAATTATPAQLALRLVPQQATELTVTDFEQLATPIDWAAADAHEPLLTRGLLRDGDHPEQQDQVLWEAHWNGGGTSGWALQLKDGATVTPPAGATVNGSTLSQGAATGASWADDPTLAALVQDTPLSSYIAKGCLPGDPVAGLQPLDAFALELTPTVATARLGTGRTDLFARMRMGSAVPEFGRVFTGGVADPVSGRIGFQLTDAAKAAQLALTHKLPFAVCSS